MALRLASRIAAYGIRRAVDVSEELRGDHPMIVASQQKLCFIVVADEIVGNVMQGGEFFKEYWTLLDNFDGLWIEIDFRTIQVGVYASAISCAKQPGPEFDEWEFREITCQWCFRGNKDNEPYVRSTHVDSYISKYTKRGANVSSFDGFKEKFSEALTNNIYIGVQRVLCLMNCKNISTIDVTDKVGPDRKWLRRTKTPEIRYHVLSINPLANPSRSASQPLDPVSDPQTPLHICRGHFKTYTEERPLFGKYTGRFWIPTHARGNPEHGIVDKDYRIVLPDDSTPLPQPGEGK